MKAGKSNWSSGKSPRPGWNPKKQHSVALPYLNQRILNLGLAIERIDSMKCTLWMCMWPCFGSHSVFIGMALRCIHSVMIVCEEA